MNAGKLRHRIVLDQPVDTQSASGATVTAFVPFGRVWAKVEPLKGREQLQANQILAEMDTRITLRWSPTVDALDATWRARHQNVVYDFKSITHVDYGRREIEILCNSGLNDG